jgi:ferredoxin
MRVTIDQNKCVASGQCLLAAPDVFDQRDEDGVVILLDPNPSPERAEDIRRAVRLCPALAITVED